MPIYHRKSYTALLLMVFVTKCSAVNFLQCFAEVTSCATNPTGQNCAFNISNVTALSILRTSNGSPIDTVTDSNITESATALSFSGCVEYCGKGQEPFNWGVFSQEYSAWLLPYLALLSQLPFGGQRRMDNLMSVFLTLGSPTLAGYSLFITLLNDRWLNDRLFAGIDYPSAEVRRSVVRVLSGLQQVPVRVHPGSSGRFEALVVHPDNDIWWSIFAAELDYSHKWSIASATSITWVVIAYLLAVANTLSNVAGTINSNGNALGTGSAWLWLLPIVVGWQVLSPKCDFSRVHDAYEKANSQVFEPDSINPAAHSIRVTCKYGVTITPIPRWKSPNGDISSPDESRIPPVFNYARILSWSQTAYVTSLFYRTAWQKSINQVGVDGNPIPEDVQHEVPPKCRLGSLDEIIDYCRPQRGGINVLWPDGVFFNMIVASLMSLTLQWGTTFSAVLGDWYIPTVGLGCHSLAYLIYGGMSTAVWLLLVLSNALGYYAHHVMVNSESITNLGTNQPYVPSMPPRRIPVTVMGENRPKLLDSIAIPLTEIQAPVVDAEEAVSPSIVSGTSVDATVFQSFRRPWIHVSTIARVANWLRWIGKTLAVVNAIGIISNSIFQYTGLYNNCFCNSSVFTWGSSAFSVINASANDVKLATSAWMGALALALTSCAFFVGAIFLVRDSLPS